MTSNTGSLKGFDPEFADIPDYIIKITERIWEGREVHRIRDWYGDDCLVHTSMGPSHGIEPVIAATLATLDLFPERLLLPEDIVWSGDDTAGYLSSHRVISPARHLGDSIYGPPTGRPLYIRALADCLCRENRIVEEWLVRDPSGICAQIGADVVAVAARLAAADAAKGIAPWHLPRAALLREKGRFMEPTLQPHAAARLCRDTLTAIWNADLAAIRGAYHPAAVMHAPGFEMHYGHQRIDRWFNAMIAAFPDALFTVENSICLEEPGRPVRTSTRWWMTGTHTGPGRYGTPSGATVLMLGINQAHVVNGRIEQEWTLFDELAVHKQIAQARAA